MDKLKEELRKIGEDKRRSKEEYVRKKNKRILEMELREKTDGKIKEIPKLLIIPESNEISFITKKINGCLKALIIKTDNSIQILINLNDYPEIEVLKEVDYAGCHYIPLRISAMSNSKTIFNYAPQEWVLNDKLNIQIKGKKGTHTEIRVLYI